MSRRRVLDDDERALYDHISPGLLDRVRIVRTGLLPPAADGMTIGRVIFMRPKHFQRSGTLMAHELVHVRQFAELGATRFLTLYVAHYLRNLVRLRNHRAAYLAIPFEREAREVAAEWAKQRS